MTFLLSLLLLLAQDQPWVAHQQAARAAREAGDFESYRTHLLALNELFTGHPTIVYSLAVAEAKLGNKDTAVNWLSTFSSMGLSQDIGKDPTFASLNDLPAFQAVQKRMAENLQPVSHSIEAFPLSEAGMISEDIVWDAKRKRFFISSVRKHKIMVADAAGHIKDFATTNWPVLALAVDSKRRVLWASTAAMPHGEGYDKKDAGRTAMLKYDLQFGALLKRFDLEEAGEHVLGDMTIASTGDIYVSDSAGGPVYTVRNERLEPVCDKKHFRSPQTPVLLPGEKKLLVADYGRGIAIVDLATRDVTWLATAGDISLIGIDGLYRAGNDLIAIQNGSSPMRIMRMTLDPTFTRVTRWKTIEANTPGLGSPSHGVVVGDTFYFLANTGWEQFDDNGALVPNAKLTPPSVWRMRL
jgi:hypothetical protein